MKFILNILLLCCLLQTSAQAPNGTMFSMPNVPVHDPVIIKQDSMYYVFCTGRGISMFSSKDKKNWIKEKPVFDSAATWAVNAVPGFKNHVWAPDISYYQGKYYLFYSVSTFGKNTSCIGLAVNKTLHTSNKDYRWEDKGKIICSAQGIDKWNAIDPNLVVDEKGNPWLSFGSFWEGIKLVPLQKDLSGPVASAPIYSIARRSRNADSGDTTSGGGAIEAPFIFKKDKYFYLFVSFDLCCKGLNSTYKMMVGRSEKITGPYLDKNNVPMTQSGGSLLLAGNETWSGVGHNAVCHFDGTDYLVFHAYDAADNGKSKLRIEQLGWDKAQWPFVIF